jgi:hypothetical protein
MAKKSKGFSELLAQQQLEQGINIFIDQDRSTGKIE